MLGLCESTYCRRKTILNYLDEEADEFCGNCDICHGSLEGQDLREITDEMIHYLTSIYKSEQKLNLINLFKFFRTKQTF